jgi:hypothetical protein
MHLTSSHAEGVGDAINIVEPRRDERDLENGTVVEAGLAQTVVVLRRHPGRVAGQQRGVVEHQAVGLVDRSRLIVPPDGFDELVGERDATQKLCV